MKTPQPRLKKGYWYIRILGRDYYLGKDWEEATYKAGELISELLIPQKRNSPQFLLSRAMDYWLDVVKPSLSHHTFLQYWYIANVIKRHVKLVHLNQFSKLRYMEMMNRFAEAGKSRGTLKQYRHVILETLRYAEIRNMVNDGTYSAFQIIPLPRSARPLKQIAPTSQEELDRVREAVGQTVYDILRLEVLTGMRPNELLRLRPRDLVKMPSGVWQYVIYRHKTSGRIGAPLIKYIGPKAQEILNRYIAPDKPDGPLFFTRLGKPHTVVTVAKRIYYLRKTVPGFPAGFHQYKCRHAAGTEARKRQGLEGAQAFLGHANRATSEIYAEVNQELAIALALEIG